MKFPIWKPYVWRHFHPAKACEIRQLEIDWNVTLPDDYKRAVALYQGCSPTPSSVELPKGNTGLQVLLTVSADSAAQDDSVQQVYEALKEHAPPKLYPFARDIGSTYFCFDYRRGPLDGKIIFFYHEEEGEDAIIPVADSFTQLLGNLKY